jgi:hypothetical protein
MRRVLESSAPWRVGVVVIGALVVGAALFLLTSFHRQYTYLGPLCLTGVVRDAGFDPWTGRPYGATIECTDLLGIGDIGVRQITVGPPEDIADRRAIPVPLGVSLGLLVLGSLALLLERRGRTPRPG